MRRATLLLAAVFLAIGAVAAPSEAQLRGELVAGGFTQPVAFVQDPSDPTVQVVVEQGGRIRALKDGVVRATDFLDLRDVVESGGERGLLGLAFAPDYATSGRLFVNFTDLDGDTVVARFRRAAGDPLRADPASRFDLQWPGGRRVVVQPFGNHNGGHLAFGPDGFLYVGLGDGGSANDPFHAAQDPQSLLGKMLRLHVAVDDSDAEGYDVPSDNPFVGDPAVLDEIWSFGLRNPWRWSFDDQARGGTGALVIADVGQNAWEEVNYEPAGRGGRNYGWRNREGTHAYATSLPPFSEPLVDPIFEYSHDEGRSITGGVVYRGMRLGAAAQGRYYFADFIESRVWSLRLTVDPLTGEATADDLVEHTADLGDAARSPASFGVDAGGELHLVSYSGSVYRLVGPDPPPPAPPPPPETPPPPSSPPSVGRRRPPGAPTVGQAVRRGSVPGDADSVRRTRLATPGLPALVIDGAAGRMRSALCPAIDAETALRLLELAQVLGPGWLWIQVREAAGGDAWIAVWLEPVARASAAPTGRRVRVVCQ
jgi:glucose/arabinose dehydrogenase